MLVDLINLCIHSYDTTMDDDNETNDVRSCRRHLIKKGKTEEQLICQHGYQTSYYNKRKDDPE